MDEKNLNEEELSQAAGGKQIARADVDGEAAAEAKQTRSTRKGKLTFRRADNPGN